MKMSRKMTAISGPEGWKRAVKMANPIFLPPISPRDGRSADRDPDDKVCLTIHDASGSQGRARIRLKTTLRGVARSYRRRRQADNALLAAQQDALPSDAAHFMLDHVPERQVAWLSFSFRGQNIHGDMWKKRLLDLGAKDGDELRVKIVTGTASVHHSDGSDSNNASIPAWSWQCDVCSRQNYPPLHPSCLKNCEGCGLERQRTRTAPEASRGRCPAPPPALSTPARSECHASDERLPVRVIGERDPKRDVETRSGVLPRLPHHVVEARYHDIKCGVGPLNVDLYGVYGDADSVLTQSERSVASVGEADRRECVELSPKISPDVSSDFLCPVVPLQQLYEEAGLHKIQRAEPVECPVCFDTCLVAERDSLQCGHLICSECLDGIKNTYGLNQACPVCRHPID